MITYSDRRDIAMEQILPIYELNGWSSARKPQQLLQALTNSHSLISAWDDDGHSPRQAQCLVGIGNAISDGYLVVYYPHLLVHPDYQGQGIGRQIMERLKQRYDTMHMHMLVADGDAISFYEKCGFTRAGKTASMWIYGGDDH